MAGARYVNYLQIKIESFPSNIVANMFKFTGGGGTFGGGQRRRDRR